MTENKEPTGIRGALSKLIHNTCTSSPLGEEIGDLENLPIERVNKLHEQQTNTGISKDPVVARIQREQALRRSKRT